MNEQILDAVTRQAATQTSRRASLLTIGATGLASMLGGSLTVAAKKNKHNNKKDKKKAQQQAEQQCEAQLAQCQSILSTISGLPAGELLCCNFLGTCDFRQFSLCFFGV